MTTVLGFCGLRSHGKDSASWPDTNWPSASSSTELLWLVSPFFTLLTRRDAFTTIGLNELRSEVGEEEAGTQLEVSFHDPRRLSGSPRLLPSPSSRGGVGGSRLPANEADEGFTIDASGGGIGGGIGGVIGTATVLVVVSSVVLATDSVLETPAIEAESVGSPVSTTSISGLASEKVGRERPSPPKWRLSRARGW